MDGQTTYMKITTYKSKDTSNNIKQIVRVFTSRILSEKLSNNEMFSPPLTWRSNLLQVEKARKMDGVMCKNEEMGGQ